MEDNRKEQSLSGQIQNDVQSAANAAKGAKNAYGTAKNAANAVKAAKTAKDAAQAAGAVKDAAKGAAKLAAGNVAGAAIDLLKSSPQLLKVVGAVLAIILVVQTTLPSLIWGNITDWSKAEDKTTVDTPDDVASSGEALVDELLDEVLLCSKKSRKKAAQISSAIQEQKSTIDEKCKSIFAARSDVGEPGTTYDPNVSGDRKISSVTKIKWGGTELNIDADSPMTFYQANKIIAAYNVATDAYVDDPDKDTPYTVSGTKDNEDQTDQIGSLADWLGKPGALGTGKYITFNVGGADGVKCYVEAWKGSFLPQYLMEQRKQEVELGTYDEDYYDGKSCALLDMLMIVSGPDTLDETISIDVTKELKNASYVETSTSYTEEEVTRYYKQLPIVENGKIVGWETIEITDPDEIEAGHYAYKWTGYVTVEHKANRTVNYQYWEYTYVGSAKVNVSIGVKDFGGIADSIGLWSGSLDENKTAEGGAS